MLAIWTHLRRHLADFRRANAGNDIVKAVQNESGDEFVEVEENTAA